MSLQIVRQNTPNLAKPCGKCRSIEGLLDCATDAIVVVSKHGIRYFSSSTLHIISKVSRTSTISLTVREALQILRECLKISSVMIPCSRKYFQVPSDATLLLELVVYSI